MKTEIYKYRLGGTEEHSMEWGILYLHDDGLFCVLSDYGEYVHCWPKQYRGESQQDIRLFISGIHWDYLLGKTRRRDYYNGEQTIQLIKEDIIRLRREQRITSDFAREEWKRTELLESKHNLMDWWNLTELHRHVDLCESAQYSYDPQAMMFAKRLFPRFQKLLKEELEAEKQSKQKENDSGTDVGTKSD